MDRLTHRRAQAMAARVPESLPPCSRRTFLHRGAAGLLLAGGLAVSERGRAVPIAKGVRGAVVLDDCDPVFKGKQTYEDKPSLPPGGGAWVVTTVVF
jgi:hypothetical protein